jgi:hypothetical protein
VSCYLLLQLWLFLHPSSSSYLLSSACVLSWHLSPERISRMEGAQEVKRPKERQLTLAAMFAPKPTAPVASSAATAASLAASDPAAMLPVFGVDKIAIHAHYRYQSPTSKKPSIAAAAASSTPPASLAVHFLTSILASRSPLTSALPLPRVAFSTPTKAGEKLAVRLTGMQRFLTYALEEGAEQEE